MSRNFTVTSESGLLTALATPCHVSQAFNPANGVPDCARIQFNALWDTGATKSVITERLVKACGLRPIRTIKPILMQGVDGFEKSEAYAINLSLPDRITFHELTVVSKDPGDVFWDVIVGMDVISTGDFSIRNVNGKTEWSFSISSKERIDNDRRLSGKAAF